ncbi:hypothetical protein RND71_037706 [Anisodus tanguticus]|uniref:MO25-like protein At5g47540 n=1 Tax=Anisodus tanguticus TaxID=243964 RepID=A0AAE1UYS5_9SOLA|nr:hypothetical protein RND71_037706 [Anisodus tanguticus]
MPIPATQIADKASGLTNVVNGSKSVKRSSSNLKKLFTKALRSTGVKSIFKCKSKPKPPADVVRRVRFLLEAVDSLDDNVDPKRFNKARKDATRIVANLQRQPVNSRLIASDYLEANTDLMDHLVSGYDDPGLALHYGAMLRECIRHQVVARLAALRTPVMSMGSFPIICQNICRYVLKSEHMKKFFDHMQIPEFDVAADATATFKQCTSIRHIVAQDRIFGFVCNLLQELMTRHKSTVAEFLFENYDWFFTEFNAKLLESSNYITRRQAIKLFLCYILSDEGFLLCTNTSPALPHTLSIFQLLGDILLDRSNSAVMTRYVSSKDNLRILMNLLREASKNIQLDAFHVFKLFVANRNKPSDIINIIVANRSKLLRFFASFKIDKEDEQFEADKAQVVKEIAELEAKGPLFSGELHKFPGTPTASGELYKSPTGLSGQLI